MNDHFVICVVSHDMTNFCNNFGGMMFFDRNLLIKSDTRSCILSKKVAYLDKKIIGKVSDLNDEQFNNYLMSKGLFIKQWITQGELPLFIFSETDYEFKQRTKLTPDDLLILKVIPSQNN